MYNHEPPGYVCPFCQIIVKAKNIDQFEKPFEVLYSSEMVTAILAIHRRPKNPVNVVVVPNTHIENLYDLPIGFARPIQQVTRAMALALKIVYQCDGISTRQHNEPAGNQDVWHYHVHVTPRFVNDDFYQTRWMDFPVAERLEHARKLSEFINSNLNYLYLADIDPI